ncbi:hypothetical protein [Halorussus litoreus]|uniref:hypothetical protein n=1 Tax=Halorussus litoreus TaxID=1710536 RepID=UPI000E278199|nr:hypothetical protein [Halorussus litoreus]
MGETDDSEPVVAVARRYLETHPGLPAGELEDELRRERAGVEQKLRSSASDDPLREVLQTEIDEIDAELRELEDSHEGTTRLFLQMLAENFVAKDEWTQPLVLRAINKALFERSRTKVVVERVVVKPGSELEPGEVETASAAIRRRAEAELAELE